MQNEALRQQAYIVLQEIYSNAAEFWHNVKMERMLKDPATLEEISREDSALALHIVQGMYYQVFYVRDVGMFFTRHPGFGNRNLREMYEGHIES